MKTFEAAVRKVAERFGGDVQVTYTATPSRAENAWVIRITRGSSACGLQESYTAANGATLADAVHAALTNPIEEKPL